MWPVGIGQQLAQFRWRWFSKREMPRLALIIIFSPKNRNLFMILPGQLPIHIDEHSVLRKDAVSVTLDGKPTPWMVWWWKDDVKSTWKIG